MEFVEGLLQRPGIKLFSAEETIKIRSAYANSQAFTSQKKQVSDIGEAQAFCLADGPEDWINPPGAKTLAITDRGPIVGDYGQLRQDPSLFDLDILVLGKNFAFPLDCFLVWPEYGLVLQNEMYISGPYGENERGEVEDVQSTAPTEGWKVVSTKDKQPSNVIVLVPKDPKILSQLSFSFSSHMPSPK